MEKEKLSVIGMSCAHCVRTIEEGVGALKGIQSVEVSLENNSVAITYNPEIVSLEAVKETIGEVGYEVE